MASDIDPTDFYGYGLGLEPVLPGLFNAKTELYVLPKSI